jgi:hypothetical protein
MKNAFDMYAKVAPDLVTASARGGVFSLIAVVLMAFMFITETYVFLGAGPVREVIDLEMDVSAELRMNVNLDFPNLECSDLTVELWRGAVWKSTFRTLYLDQIEVDSADFWTDRSLSSSSRSRAEESGAIRSITHTLKSC